MYRLLIAEDEPLEREGLAEAIGRLCPLIGELRVVENGRQALELAESFDPDICLLDIKMPGIDGIEAGKTLRERREERQLIYLTAFDQFDYAREALRIKASEFLVKPATDEEVARAVESAIATLQEREEAGKSQEELSRTVELLTPLAERQLMERLFLGDQDSLDRLSNLFGASGEIALLILRINTPTAEQLSPVAGRREARLRRFTRAVIRTAERLGYSVLPWESGNELRFGIVPGPEAESPDRLKDSLDVRLEEEGAREGVGPKAIISDTTRSAEEFAHWSTECSVGLDRPATQAGLRSLAEVRADARELGGEYESERLLLTELQRGSGESVRKLAQRLVSAEEDRALLSERLVYFAHALRVPAAGATEALREERDGSLREAFLTGLEEVRRRYRERKSGDLSPAVQRTREYIDHHYMEDLALESLAKAVHISEYHLSRLFRRETGKTVVGYITEKRLEVARELLSEGLLSVKEVSARIGFGDPSYFTRVFTKREGVSPRDFRSRKVAP